MSKATDRHVLTFLFSAIALITLPHAYNVPLPIFAFFALLLGWRFFCVWKPQYLPPSLLTFFLTLLSLIVLFSQYHTVLGRDAGTSLFLVALGLKLLEIKQERDLYLVTYLAFIVATSLFLYEQSILMAGYILLVSCVLLATLVSINSPQPQTKAALKKAAIIIGQALPLTLVIFVLFPRVEAPRWMLFKNQAQGKLGLSDSLEPGSISDLGLSKERVFRVKFAGALPPPQQRYWRGPAYIFTNGKVWLQAPDFSFNNQQATPKFRGKAYHYTLLMEPQDKSWVFGLDLPQQLPSNVLQNATYQLISSADFSKRMEYPLISYPQYNTGAISPSEYQQNVQLPHKLSAQITQLVQKLHGFDQPAPVFIQAVLNHFRQEKFSYTLTPPLMESEPIDTFLFKTRRGFCSHYATAFVYLMRIAHIPARVIGGYQGGEMNQVGQFLEVRQADAHAWAEVWLENQGWVRVDPTAAIAPERIERGVNVDAQVANQAINFVALQNNGRYPWLKQALQLWENVDYNWQRWVINYDRANQGAFLASLGIVDIKTLLQWLIGTVMAVTAIVAWFLLRQRYPKTEEAVRLYTQFCHKFRPVALIRLPNEGAADFAQRASAALPRYAEQIQVITALYLALRYGKNPPPQLLKQLESAVKQFKLVPTQTAI